jgi:hypothetical protein
MEHYISFGWGQTKIVSILALYNNRKKLAITFSRPYGLLTFSKDYFTFPGFPRVPAFPSTPDSPRSPESYFSES